METKTNTNVMKVVKRNGTQEEISFDKISTRVKKIISTLGVDVDYSIPCIKTIDQLKNMITSEEIDEILSQQCVAMTTTNPIYGDIAARIVISRHHRKSLPSFCETMKRLYLSKKKDDRINPTISKDLYDICCDDTLSTVIDSFIEHDRDYLISYFGFKTLERSYLLRRKDALERPQYLWMRVALGIHGNNLERVKETYDLMSNKFFVHATPTLYHAGTPRPQLSSCFLESMESDSIDGIFSTLKDCALISKFGGGIGLPISNIRSKGSNIFDEMGKTNGIVPMLRVFNNTARYVDQNGKRKGSFAIYMEPWHAEIEDFLNLRKNHGAEESRARDLFYALWIPDLFMKRIESGEKWSLFCPYDCPDLIDLHGEAFEARYTDYEKNHPHLIKKQISARELWYQTLDSLMETGTPYITFKDSANNKSNQQNLGTIRSSNLCAEIIEYSSSEETAVCNLASVALPSFVDSKDKTFNYNKLHQVTCVVARNLDKVIDINYYPIEKTRRSNMRHRPIGIGIQGLADVFALMDIPFHSDAARQINVLIAETMYHAAIYTSVQLAKELGKYESFEGSPASKGILQFDMWKVSPASFRYDWDKLRGDMKEFGLRNSLSIACMPTASTAQILGFNECFEPFTTNIYSRSTIAGNFVVINRYLMDDLMNLGLWNEDIKNSILKNNGSIQQLTQLPTNLLEKYKTVWEIPARHIIDMCKDRGAYVCQSQSMNLWFKEPSYKLLTSALFHAWKGGLKTGCYYMRRKAVHQAQQFTIEPDKHIGEKRQREEEEGSEGEDFDNYDNNEICESCSA